MSVAFSDPNKMLVGVANRTYHLKLNMFVDPDDAQVDYKRNVQWDFGLGDVHEVDWDDEVPQTWPEPGVYEIKIRYYANYIIRQEIRKVRIGLAYSSAGYSDAMDNGFDGIVAYVMRVREKPSAPQRLVALLFRPEFEHYDLDYVAGEEYWNDLVTAENPLKFGDFTKEIEQCYVKEVLGKPLPDPRFLDEGMYGFGKKDIVYAGLSDDLKGAFLRLRQALEWDYQHGPDECNPAAIFGFVQNDQVFRHDVVLGHPFRPYSVALPEGAKSRTGSVIPDVDQDRVEEARRRHALFEDLWRVQNTTGTHDAGLSGFATLETIFEIFGRPPEDVVFEKESHRYAFEGFLKLLHWWRRLEAEELNDPALGRDQSLTWLQSTYRQIYEIVEKYDREVVRGNRAPALDPPMVLVSLNCEDLSLGVRVTCWDQDPQLATADDANVPGLIAWRHVFTKLCLTTDVDGTKDIEGRDMLPTVEQMYRDRSGEFKVWPEALAQAVFHVDPPEKVVWTREGNYRLNPFTRTVRPATEGPKDDRVAYIASRAGGANQIPIQCSRVGDLSRGGDADSDRNRSAQEDTDTLGLGSMLGVDRMMKPEFPPTKGLPWLGTVKDPGDVLVTEDACKYEVNRETGYFGEATHVDTEPDIHDLRARVMQVVPRAENWSVYVTNQFGTEVGLVHKIVQRLREADRLIMRT